VFTSETGNKKSSGLDCIHQELIGLGKVALKKNAFMWLEGIEIKRDWRRKEQCALMNHESIKVL